ncbi:MAG: DUF2299 family protein [Gammaproteobacteria bacterium]|nr:DUF2299 family protein [Gammaproteobacteria bacterium]
MLELTQEKVSDWAASFGWTTSPVELEPDAEEQWAVHVPGENVRYGTYVAWYAPPANLLAVRINLQVHDDNRALFANLNFTDRLAFLTNLRVSMARHHHAVEYMLGPASDADTPVPVPDSVAVVASVVVDESFSRKEFFRAFRSVQSAMTDVDVMFQRLALGRMLP